MTVAEALVSALRQSGIVRRCLDEGFDKELCRSRSRDRSPLVSGMLEGEK
jgi:hypothetical protein